jgi:hypothetical protein
VAMRALLNGHETRFRRAHDVQILAASFLLIELGLKRQATNLGVNQSSTEKTKIQSYRVLNDDVTSCAASVPNKLM